MRQAYTEKIIIPVSYFRRTLNCRCLKGSCLKLWIYQLSKYAEVLNIPGLLMCQGSEYASGLKYVRVLDKSRF